MVTTIATQNKRSDGSMATYLRLLEEGAPQPADWEMAAELIAAGMANGLVHRNAMTARGEIDSLVGFAPTLAGRAYAQQLREQQASRSVLGRMKAWILVLLGYVGGSLSDPIGELLMDALKRLLA